MHIHNDISQITIERTPISADYSHEFETFIAVTSVPYGGVDITLNLPADFVNIPLTIKLETTLGSGVNIIPSSGSIDGASGYSFAASYECLRLYSNGSNFYKI